MIQKQKITRFSKLVLASFLLIVTLAVPAAVAAETQDPKNPGRCTTDGGKPGVWVNIAVDGKHCIANDEKNTTLEQNPIYVYAIGFIKFLGVGVGIAVVGGVVYGGVLFVTARGNAAQVQKAVNTILNSIIGLGLFILLFAIMNFLIPGGIFR